MNKFKLVLTVASLTVVFASCAKKEGLAPGEESSTNPPSSPSEPAAVPLTPSQIAGSHDLSCIVVSGGIYGTDVNGMSILKNIYLGTNGIYNYSILLFTGTVCQFGGTQIFNYTHSGTYTLHNAVSTPANSTEIAFTTSSSMLTIYAASGAASTWAGYFNAYCPGGPTNFSTTGTSTRSEAGRTCSHLSSPAFSFPRFPDIGEITYDVISLDSVTNPTVLNSSVSSNLFFMGQFASYPTTLGTTFSF